MTDFLDLPDLACEAVGGVALACNDDDGLDPLRAGGPAKPEIPADGDRVDDPPDGVLDRRMPAQSCEARRPAPMARHTGPSSMSRTATLEPAGGVAAQEPCA